MCNEQPDPLDANLDAMALGAQALSFAQADCARGEDAACEALSYFYKSGLLGTDRNWEKARAIDERLCAKGKGRSTTAGMKPDQKPGSFRSVSNLPSRKLARPDPA